MWYSTSSNPQRKYPHSWELTQTLSGDWIGVNTLRANTLVEEAIREGKIPELTGYGHLQREVRYGAENSRIDLLLQAEQRISCYIEVKSVTLLQYLRGYFPDAVTLRGQKHLRELQNVVESGQRALLIFVVLHTGISQVSPAFHIDPDYARLLVQAQQKGVEILCYNTQLSPEGMVLQHPVPLLLENHDQLGGVHSSSSNRTIR